MSYSLGRAALAGFRLAGVRPLSVFAWSVGSFAALFVAAAGAILAAGGLKALSVNAIGGFSLASAMMRFYAVFLPVTVAWSGILYCAVFRAVMRPGEARYAYLRLGHDELRMIGLLGLFSVVAAIGGVGAVMLLAAVREILGGLVVAVAGPGFEGWGVVVGLVMIAAVAVWIGVRISFAGPMTFATGRFQIARAWALTEGSFWRLFGAYAIAWLLGVAMLMVPALVAVLAVRAMAPGDGGQILNLVSIALNLLLGGVFYAALIAPAAVAYDALAPRRQELAETFA